MKSRLARIVLASLAPSMALVAGGPGGGKPTTITGVIVDTACYIGHDAKGAGHAKCATLCAKAGIPLAVLEDASGLLYLPLSLDHKNPNEKLLPYVEKRVKVTGVVMQKGGMRGIVIREISESK
ncbi:MAG: hypothetical protein RMK57_01785 [Bryobacterales bacterium]|nr:hypothetical protein [Bryobacteraceae bacterium]MDW8353236.1 hypothetical protein [Bryobacterales bacterium]